MFILTTTHNENRKVVTPSRTLVKMHAGLGDALLVSTEEEAVELARELRSVMGVPFYVTEIDNLSHVKVLGVSVRDAVYGLTMKDTLVRFDSMPRKMEKVSTEMVMLSEDLETYGYEVVTVWYDEHWGKICANSERDAGVEEWWRAGCRIAQFDMDCAPF